MVKILSLQTKKAARRRQLMDMLIMEKNHGLQADKSERSSIDWVIKLLEKEIKLIDQAIDERINIDLELKNKRELLQSIRGIGSIVASAIIADLPELGSITSSQVSALVGVAPFNVGSDKMRGRRAIAGGRAMVRKGLYMAALVASRHNKKIREFYQKLCTKGKPKKVALVACMRKLIIIMNIMIRRNEG